MNPIKSHLLKFLGIGIVSFALSPALQAADGSWNVNAAGNWATAANPPWLGGVVPGSTITTNNTDTATFAFSLNTTRIVTVDTNRNIGNILFGNTGAGGYSLRTGNLLLSNGGAIQTLAANGDHTDAITAAIAIQGVGGSASFTAGATSSGSIMLLTGAITGVSTGGNTTTLTLTGSNAGENKIGTISDGSAGGNLAIIKNGTGQWQLGGTGLYSGGTTLNDGILKVVANANNALGTGGIVNLNGGELWLSHSTGRNLGRDAVVGGDVTITSDIIAAGAGVTNSLAALSIGAHTLTVRGGANVTSGTAGYTFTGATTLTGAATFNVLNPVAAGTSTLLTLGSTVVNGGFLVSFAGTGDSSVADAISGSGGVAKSGAGTLTLNGVNTYTGDTTVTAGTMILADNAGMKFVIAGNGVNNTVTGVGVVTLNGDFTFDLTSAGTTFGDTWNIVNVATLAETFGSTFNVNGFTRQGGGSGAGIWEGSANSTAYQFDSSDGNLSVVPEPATWVLLVVGLSAMTVFRRRRLA